VKLSLQERKSNFNLQINPRLVHSGNLNNGLRDNFCVLNRIIPLDCMYISDL
jgi:hypothetical protein